MPELAKAYEPQQVEDRLYQKWQESGVYVADPKSAKPPYSIVMPPPNVTGKLTLGHVLNNTIQDILARKARMDGREVLWLPGTDHAGLATQTAVEKHIRNTEKKTRYDFTRDEFVERVWQWKEEFGGIIAQQLRKIGASCDWSRERFTMDPEYAEAVGEVFVKLYHEGHIYRGTRMVNWCPGSLTAISDEEVIPTKQKGSLYYVKYELIEESGGIIDAIAGIAPAFGGMPPETTQEAEHAGGTMDALVTPTFLTVATTRPETIMADQALAVKPGGKWAHLVGRKVWRPLHRVPIPIIADQAVEEGFGTGVLKVTPAHDKTDYEIGKRHNLTPVDILTPSGKINDPGDHDAAELNGLDRFEARKRSAELLRERGLLEKEEPYENTVGFSERAGVPIEPRLSEQWFLTYPNIDDALALLRDGHVKFHPAHWTKVYEHWLANIQDWCISRQVWWGHRIPVWYKKSSPKATTPGREISVRFPITVKDLAAKLGREPYEVIHELMGMNIFSSAASYVDEDAVGRLCWKLGHDLAIEKPEAGAPTAPASIKMVTRDGESTQVCCQLESPGEGWTQDPDTLDTWFSSWLWAYETMQADDGTRAKFYPTSALVTGPDIIFLWVARMLIAGLHFLPKGKQTDKAATLEANLAFKDVYYTGLIRDKQGRKLSKSLGNSPDPLDLIAKYGADGLRFGLVRIAPQGADIRFDEKQIEEGRNFCNKLWNICRFRTMHGAIDPQADPSKHARSIFADELLRLLHDVVVADPTAIDSFNFSEAASRLYAFVWDDFASRFVEAAKLDFTQADSPTRAGTLATFDYVLSRVLRLLHPFAPFVTEELWSELGFGASLQLEPWPAKIFSPQKSSSRAADIYAAADQGRSLRGELGLPSNQKIPFYLAPADGEFPAEQQRVLQILLNASELHLGQPENPGPKAFTPLGELYLPGSGLIDPAKDIERLKKELVKVIKDLEQTRKNLGNAKAPPAKIEEWRALEISLVAKEKSVRESLEKLGGA
jgi:valyl-tRNA synthetase